MTSAAAPVLIFGYGNESRADDGLGPLVAALLERQLGSGRAARQVECLTDYQLQVEHALDLEGRRVAVFVDASISAAAPFDLSPLAAQGRRAYTSHSVSPGEVLEVYREITGCVPPPAFVLAVRGENFEFDAPMSAAARSRAQQATDLLAAAIVSGDALAALRAAIGEDLPA